MSIFLSGFLFAQGGTISGKITDKDNGKPLVAANVMVSGDALKSMTGSATDAEGRYTVPNLPSGQYTLKVNYMGYEQVKKEVTLDPGQKLVVDFQLLTAIIQMETYVVTASRRRERVEDAPAAISVITKQDIRRESNTNLGDYMKTTKGIDFTQSGIDSYNMTARGFNSSFSSRLLSLTDGRMANVPSLRLTAYNVIPVSFEDVEQIEIVLGPSSALYGPNAHSGVLNIITSSPLRSPILYRNSPFELHTNLVMLESKSQELLSGDRIGNILTKVNGKVMMLRLLEELEIFTMELITVEFRHKATRFLRI